MTRTRCWRFFEGSGSKLAGVSSAPETTKAMKGPPLSLLPEVLERYRRSATGSGPVAGQFRWG